MLKKSKSNRKVGLAGWAVIGFAVVGLAAAFPVFAQPIMLEVPFGSFQRTSADMSYVLVEYLVALYEFIVGAIGIIAAVMIMFNGVRWAAAAGNSERITEAKDGIISALVGLVLALGSFTILNAINPALVTPNELMVAALELEGIAHDNYEIAGCSLDNKPLVAAPKSASQANCGPVPNQGGGGTLTRAQIASIINANKGEASGVFVLSIATHESNLCTSARSDIKNSDGDITHHACGVIQMIPKTAEPYAKDCGLADFPTGMEYPHEWTDEYQRACDLMAQNPDKALCMGTQHIRDLYDANNGDEVLMAAAYNAGQYANNQSKDCPGYRIWQCPPKFAETRKYIPYVDGDRRSLCQQLGGEVTDP